MTCSEAIIKRIRVLCDQKGITINKLATMSGVTQSTLNNIIHGTNKSPRLDTLYKIATGFNMTVSELLDCPEINETFFDELYRDSS